MILENPPGFVVDGVRPPSGKPDHPRRRPDIMRGCGSHLMRMAERQRQFSRVLGRFLVYDDRVDVLAITGSKQPH
jgi:hypothetical protein